MVEFAGYSLPIQYKEGVVASHNHVRSEGGCGLFDVSHMGQVMWTGADAAAFIEHITVADLTKLEPGSSTLSMITNEDGGIIDDTVITNTGNGYYMVVNGACKQGDVEHFDRLLCNFEGDVQFDLLNDRALMALQGPAAAAVLQRETDTQLAPMAFMTSTVGTVAGVEDCFITRCGYTGEDGFEVSVPAEHAEAVANALAAHAETQPTGLAVRDSLRLEAGLCLYGQDIHGTTSPVEAGLKFTISPRRIAEGGFLGAERIQHEAAALANVARRRVGLTLAKVPAREGSMLYKGAPGADVSGDDLEAWKAENVIGHVTSGTFSPSLKKPISMGYLKRGFTKAGRVVFAEVRGKFYEATITKMPFVPAKYYRP